MAKDASLPLDHYEKVPVREIKVGMFVRGISRQKKTADLTPGLITSPQTVIHLVSMGIEEVIIDVARSKIELTEKPVAVATPPSEAPVVEATPEMPLEPETKTAQRERLQHLYGEAKSLQCKLVLALKEGEHIDVAPLEAMADELVDSIFTNADAMIYLSRIREKDTYLMEHSLNVGMLLANFGRFLGLPRPILKELLVGGLLHDTGKIMIPDEVLHKPGKLTPEEFGIMKRHVEYGVRFLEHATGITPIMLRVVAHHHERLDGMGYPRGLTAPQLDQVSRMSTIVDVFDALTADRCYKKGMPAVQAFRILMQGGGTQFDEILVNKFIKCMGVHPTGSVVRMKSGRLAMVLERNDRAPLRPVIKLVYDPIQQCYLDLAPINLAETPVDEIEITVDPREYNIDIRHYY